VPVQDAADHLRYRVVSGVFSGAFGIAAASSLRLHPVILGAPALVQSGRRSRDPSQRDHRCVQLSAARAGRPPGRRRAGTVSALTAVLGAWLTQFAGGKVVLLATAALVIYTAADMVLQAYAPPSAASLAESSEPETANSGLAPVRVVVIGAVTGLYAGFLGLGGGFILVPHADALDALRHQAGYRHLLVAIAILSVPGTITHALLGHIDWGIALVLTLGVVPARCLGARLSLVLPTAPSVPPSRRCSSLSAWLRSVSSGCGRGWVEATTATAEECDQLGRRCAPNA